MSQVEVTGPVLPLPCVPHLATLTGVHTIVEAGGYIPTHLTQEHHAVEFWGSEGKRPISASGHGRLPVIRPHQKQEGPRRRSRIWGP